jgi:NAD(P)-dependent dehydrogenase (short-subunit alcohol dehydrogenase family)
MTNIPDLTGKTALITGASRGIGAAVAKAYAKAGAHVILLARTRSALEKIDDDIRAEGGSATLMPFNLTRLDEIDKLGPALYEKFGGLDIFVGNAGLLGTLGPLAHSKADEFEKVMAVNVSANYRLIRTLDPLLQKSDAGRAIFVTSGVTHGLRAYWGAYTVSKCALEGLANTYAAETKETNVRVNIVDPGRVRTKMRASAYPGEDPMTLPAPEDIVPVFMDLVSEDCTHHGEVVDAYAA